MIPTPFQELNAILEELGASVSRTLGGNLVGLYLQGSFAVGDFDEHSDVDFVAVIESELSGEDVARLDAMHERIYALDCEWAKHLEGSYFTKEELRGPAGKPVWYLDHGSTKMVRSDHCNTMVVRWTLERHGIPLLGPATKTLLDPVAPEDLRAEIRSTMIDWGCEILAKPEDYANRFYQGFILLSYCRMLHSMDTGRIGSKLAGANWAKSNLPERWHALIDRAWACRPNPAVSVRAPADPEDFAATLDFVRLAIERAGC